MNQSERAALEAKYCPNGVTAVRRTIERLCEVTPSHLHEGYWERWRKGGWLKADVDRMIEEIKEAKRQGDHPLSRTQTAERNLQTLKQTADKTREAIDREMEREAKQRRQIYEQTLHTWIEVQYANQQQAEAWLHRYDPCGLWGDPVLASDDR